MIGKELDVPAAYRIARPYSSIQLDEVEWLWPGRILKNEVSLFIGAPKVGKDFLMFDVAARVSRGWPMPPFDPIDPTAPEGDMPGNVITITNEDKPSDTVKPRIIAADGDEDRIFDLTYVKRRSVGGNSIRTKFSLPQDLDVLESAMDEVGDVRLIIMTPLLAISTVAISGNMQVRRQVIEPLQDIAERRGTSIAVVHHFNKFANTGNLADKINGSGGILGAARLTNAIVKDDISGIRRVLTLGSNLQKEDFGEAIEYRIVGDGQDAHVRYKLPPPTEGAAQDTIQAHVLAMLIKARRPVSSQEMATYLELSHGVVREILAAAKEKDFVEKHRGSYVITEKARLAIEGPEKEEDGERTLTF
jgi:hypothetical protein